MDIGRLQEFLGVPAVLESAAIQQVIALARRVAGSQVAVLITGETGSGKEIVARAIQNPKQFHLHARIQFADLVQKQGAPVSHFK